MELLFRFKFEHHSPKDSAVGIDGYLLADTEEAAERYALANNWVTEHDDEEDEEYSAELGPDELTAEMAQRAVRLGLPEPALVEWGAEGAVCYEGTYRQIFLLTRHCPMEPDDCYYGHTSQSFEFVGEVTSAEGDTLVRLGIAERIKP